VTGPRAVVDAARCVGHGMCYASFPELFVEDAYGHADAYLEPLSTSDVGPAEHAVANCPEGAIRIER
jgi:ferredoxin